MSNLKERLQQIKIDVALELYNCGWLAFFGFKYDELSKIEKTIFHDEVCKRYAEEAIKEASERACDELELYPSEYKKLESSILSLIKEL